MTLIYIESYACMLLWQHPGRTRTRVYDLFFFPWPFEHGTLSLKTLSLNKVLHLSNTLKRIIWYKFIVIFAYLFSRGIYFMHSYLATILLEQNVLTIVMFVLFQLISVAYLKKGGRELRVYSRWSHNSET